MVPAHRRRLHHRSEPLRARPRHRRRRPARPVPGVRRACSRCGTRTTAGVPRLRSRRRRTTSTTPWPPGAAASRARDAGSTSSSGAATTPPATCGVASALWFSGRWYTAAVGDVHRRRAGRTWPTASGRPRTASSNSRGRGTCIDRGYSGGTATARARRQLGDLERRRAVERLAVDGEAQRAACERDGRPTPRRCLAVLRAAASAAGEDLEHEAGARRSGCRRVTSRTSSVPSSRRSRHDGPKPSGAYVPLPIQPSQTGVRRAVDRRGRAAPSAGARGRAPRRGRATCRAGAAAPPGRRRPRCSRRS